MNQIAPPQEPSRQRASSAPFQAPSAQRSRRAAPPTGRPRRAAVDGQVSLEELRAAVAAQVAETEKPRAVAREIGISGAGLQNFLAGGVPYAKTRRRLVEWWARDHGHRLPEVSSPAIAESIDALMATLPPERRPAVGTELVDTLRRLYDAHAEHCPPWMAELAGAATGRDPARGGPDGGPA
jgi:hypothetical protein